MLPPFIVLDPILQDWLREDIGRGDRSTSGLFPGGNAPIGQAVWIAKADGVIAGLAIAARVFRLLDADVSFVAIAQDGKPVKTGDLIAKINGSLATLLMGERVALNLVMRLSGIASTTAEYVKAIAHTKTRLVDTRKTIPGMRIMEKYATFIGGAINHRYGLDDAVMLKDNHIAAAGGIKEAVQRVRENIPFTTSIEVETESIAQVREAVQLNLDVIMLDNMPLSMMRDAIAIIRQHSPHTKIEASGNITLETIAQVAELGMDYISTSAMVTRSPWLDISMRIK
ncbi:carboxylating nicotinate-nucleotide diphosphorylase [Pseudanabaena sp. FACHB-1998]|uniref:carboxylating nicotinate-nucleotide diphosphorylase n=1 Tax=Pseudanabaena sp. FACHB-1998 TaxID=2692858 RepID=UPI0016800C83|nr:carboxylating nicotinate-nucleotide diphosphorylase [Pseudanabaena sp. FACHB-1998]MBD2176778.1 carboxylating nicotinate-nucleotide diphosphorylase [Pseudanabaena sp. FACHB-1998]